MKIPVIVNIKTERSSHDPMHIDTPRVEVRTAKVNGYMHRTKKGLTCVFSEDDKDTVTTVSTLGENLVSVNKIGDFNSLMVFDPEKSYSCVYNNGVMPMHLKVNTKSLRNGLTEQGGKIDIDYTVEIVGNVAEHTKMSFSVLPETGLIS